MVFFFFMVRRPRSSTLFPYTTLFRSEPYPGGIGAADAQLLFSGQKAVYEASQLFLRPLGGDLRFIGEKVGAANALDLANLAWSLGRYVGFAHGARLCESEGVGLDVYAARYPEGDRIDRKSVG